MVIAFRYLENSLDKTFITGRSKCDFCSTPLSLLDLIPVLSWLFQRGKCRYCKHKLSLLYPLYEIVLGIAFIILLLTSQPVIVWVFVCYLFFLSVIDSKSGSIDARFIDYPLLALLFYFIFRILINKNYDFEIFLPLLYSSSISLLLIVINYFKKSFGVADILIYFSLGLIFSYEVLLTIFVYSVVLGAIYALFLMLLCKKSKKTKIALIPFIFIATIIAVVFNLCYYLPICPI